MRHRNHLHNIHYLRLIFLHIVYFYNVQIYFKNHLLMFENHGRLQNQILRNVMSTSFIHLPSYILELLDLSSSII
jgi:hypothetical protein